MKPKTLVSILDVVVRALIAAEIDRLYRRTPMKTDETLYKALTELREDLNGRIEKVACEECGAEWTGEDGRAPMDVILDQAPSRADQQEDGADG